MAPELELTLIGESDLGSRASGWARGYLSLAGEPYWAGEDDGPFDWTWIELLTWLVRHWSALTLEEGWPLPLARVRHPGDLLPQARERWGDLPQAQVDQEQIALYGYLDRHNLACALHGAYAPALTLARAGNTIWLVDEDQQPTRADFTAIYTQLERIGEQLADYFSPSTQPQVQETLTLWRERTQGLPHDRLRYRAGLAGERLQRIGTVALSLIEQLPPDFAPTCADTPYLAAARMARHLLTSPQIGKLIETIHREIRRHTPLSPRLVAASRAATLVDGKPWEQGYRLAQWLRAELTLAPDQRFDPLTLLNTYDVAVITERLDIPAIDAIACWGEAAPFVIVNTHPDARSSTSHGQRSTLAHEICHLLVDRERALPVAEVLGGEVDVECEQRANAFAAEMLLPQAWAARVWATAASPDTALAALRDSHGVSRQLAAQHLLNTPALSLTEDDRVLLHGESYNERGMDRRTANAQTD
ncbi:ImmA/IrrE family metallo-endopeptidase [uncultured Thiodictyon sp.]|jgi:Zn-dependent peptidase ImmA (M78 family)|uniref:ImmA/IrrE family metallo-endopeptidase n=1 Tax=uncultured Thiodictyon sp. TaxID=1846217 RepID=UPI0025E69042|nr:ImmA/IrrE family metallo-endopeptidase [uncultured Thiodictyon sp.]